MGLITWLIRMRFSISCPEVTVKPLALVAADSFHILILAIPARIFFSPRRTGVVEYRQKTRIMPENRIITGGYFDFSNALISSIR